MKAKGTESRTRFLRGADCPIQIACDGRAVTVRRLDKGCCGLCETALKKRGLPMPPPIVLERRIVR
jgi:hypothetical protein